MDVVCVCLGGRVRGLGPKVCSLNSSEGRADGPPDSLLDSVRETVRRTPSVQPSDELCEHTLTIRLSLYDQILSN